MMTLYVGTAGWSVPKAYQEYFSLDGSHLKRYSAQMNCVEINTSFYRPHKPETYKRWAEVVPEHFRFSAKVPKAITHDKRLKQSRGQLEGFLTEVRALGNKLGSLLIQLPPSLAFDEVAVTEFLAIFRECYYGYLICEPRHQTWFGIHAESVLKKFQVAQVAADPPVSDRGLEPLGAQDIHYYRLHGSPKIYYSNYDSQFLDRLRACVNRSLASRRDVWCIFDNTALGYALGNALEFSATPDHKNKESGLPALNL